MRNDEYQEILSHLQQIQDEVVGLEQRHGKMYAKGIYVAIDLVKKNLEEHQKLLKWKEGFYR